MAQDFAKKRSSSQKSGSRKNTRGVTRAVEHRESGWSWFFSGLFCGLFIAFISYLALNPGETATAPAQAGAEDQASEESSRGSFDFYGYLPEAVVEVDVVPVEVTREQARLEDTDQYLLQAGSFQNRQDAEGRRANVILLNLDATVTPGIVAGKTWHRVQVGPFTGRHAAEEARNILSSNNIDTIVLRLQQ